MSTPVPARADATTDAAAAPSGDHAQALLSAMLASQAWVEAFNRGDVGHCADTYTANALLEAKPMGTYQGREAIRAFWAGLVASGARNLVYARIKIEQIDARTMLLSARWTMNIGGGFISLERWENHDGRWMLAEDRFEVETPA